MGKKPGSFLEDTVGALFSRAGFDVKLRSRINTYEIDVLATMGGCYSIAVECKHYDRSNITIRNIMHEWNSKRDNIDVDKIAVVIVGQEPTEKDYELAGKVDIILLGEEVINDLGLIATQEELREELNDLFCFDQDAYDKKNRGKLFWRRMAGFFKVVAWITWFAILILWSILLVKSS